MRILFLAGTNSIHSHRWANYFAHAGHEVHVVSFARTIQPILPSIRYREIISSLPFPLSAFAHARIVKRIAQEVRPDVLHAHSAGIYGFVALLAGFHPFVLTAWGTDVLLNPRAFLKRLIVKRILRAADLITTDGENTAKAMARLGADPRKIKRILFGTDIEKFRPRPETKKEGPPRIISIRSLEPVYDIETLLRAAAIVLGPFPHAEFVIAGDGSERARLEALAKDLGVANSIRFIGKISAEQAPLELAAADVYVSTSLSDSGLAASTAEAMASGLPVVVTDSGDNRKWVEDGSTGSPQAGGFVVPCRNPEALAKKLTSLLQDKGARQSFGAHNRRVIEERNSYSREMEKMNRLYEEIAKERQATAR